ncbi:unnamed protein product [Rhizopus stolonifer]
METSHVKEMSKEKETRERYQKEETQSHSRPEEFYECNICFDRAIHPVLTLCGHLFCWSCLAQWLHAQSRNPTCPVCKAGCGKNKVIPIYGRGKEEVDFRTDPSIPTRPVGQRPPLSDPNQTNYFFGDISFISSYQGAFISRWVMMLLSLLVMVIVFA